MIENGDADKRDRHLAPLTLRWDGIFKVLVNQPPDRYVTATEMELPDASPNWDPTFLREGRFWPLVETGAEIEV